MCLPHTDGYNLNTLAWRTKSQNRPILLNTQQQQPVHVQPIAIWTFPLQFIFSILFALVCVLEECVCVSVAASPHSLYQRFILICIRECVCVCVCIVPVNSNKHSHSLTLDRAKSHHTFFSFIFDFPRIRSLFVSIKSTGSVCCLSCRIVCVISMGFSSHPRTYPFRRRIVVLNFALCRQPNTSDHRCHRFICRASCHPCTQDDSILGSKETLAQVYNVVFAQSIRWQSN